MKKIGITLRQSSAQGYNEPRDALATDWYRLFEDLAWEHQWMLLPNLGSATLDYALKWQIDGLILSGGEDHGCYPHRDAAELSLLEHAAVANWPVLGVCRGMQLLQLAAGGELEAVDRSMHVAQPHPLQRVSLPWYQGSDIKVNSFHGKGVVHPAEVMRPLAWYEGCCEAMQHKQLPWIGIMWHPERETQLTDVDRALFSWLFGN